MRPLFIPLLFALLLVFYFCSGIDLIDDYIPPDVRITTPLSSMTIGTSVHLKASYFNNVGDHIQDASIKWISSNSEIITIDPDGIATPHKEGVVELIAQITTEDNELIQDIIRVTVISNVKLVTDPVENEIVENTTTRPTIEILNSISEITAQTSYQLEINITDENGNEAVPSTLLWTSSDEAILSVDQEGNINAIGSGMATITISFTSSNTVFTAQNFITVIALEKDSISSFSGNLVTKSGYTLEGSFTLSKTESGLILSLGEDYKASATLPGLYVYLSNNNNTTSQAYEIDAVKVFNGSHSYTLPSSIELMDYQYLLYWCKPFNVKVGEAKIYD
jgi:hypothetical protein